MFESCHPDFFYNARIIAGTLQQKRVIQHLFVELINLINSILMKTAKFILGLVALSLFCSCVKYEGEKKVYPEKEYLIASERGYYHGEGCWVPYYFARVKGSNKWETYDHIEGFEFVHGQ